MRGCLSTPDGAGTPCRRAGIAQSVEHLICNQGVAGSNPAAGTKNTLKLNHLSKVSPSADTPLVFVSAPCPQKGPGRCQPRPVVGRLSGLIAKLARSRQPLERDQAISTFLARQSGVVADFAEGSPCCDMVATGVRALPMPARRNNLNPTKPVVGCMLASPSARTGD